MHKEQSIRIIGGKYRSRVLFWPSNIDIRPTKDKIKEAIYSSLYNVNDFTILDLFAGSGAFALEGLSRGAKKVYLNDISSTSIQCINKNVDVLNCENDVFITQLLDFDALKLYYEKNIKFDVIFIDPPYKYNQYKQLLDIINEYDLLNINATIIIEHNHDFDYDENVFEIVKEKRYGEINISFIKKRKNK